MQSIATLRSTGCRNSEQKSWTSAVSSTAKSYETTRNEKSLKPMSQRGACNLSTINSRRQGIAQEAYLYRSQSTDHFSTHRQALRYIVRNTSLPQSMRTQAQLQLASMHCYTRPTQIKNRCIMGGIAKGVFRDFRMGRVCLISLYFQTVLWLQPGRSAIQKQIQPHRIMTRG